MSLPCSNIFKKFRGSCVVPAQKLEQVLNSVQKHKAGTEIFLDTGLTKEVKPKVFGCLQLLQSKLA